MFEKRRILRFNGVFAERCRAFVAYKRSLGLKYDTEGYIMEKFDQMTVSSCISEPMLTRELANAFVSVKPGESNKSAYKSILYHHSVRPLPEKSRR